MAPKRPSKPNSGGKGSKSSSATKSRSKPSKPPSKPTTRPAPSKQVKTRPGIHSAPILGKSSISKNGRKPSRRTYTDAELGLPALNSIIPFSAAPARKGSGKKKNKVFVDDEEGMLTIMALVNADKEGEIESKMVKMRRLEEIRDLKRLEAEKREGERRERLEGVKKGLRKKKGKGVEEVEEVEVEVEGRGKEVVGRKKKKRKSVSFVGV